MSSETKHISYGPQSPALSSPLLQTTLPAWTGLGLKQQHIDSLLDFQVDIAFLEIHAENYMGDGGAPHVKLAKLCEIFPLSIHGVGLSIGGDQPIDRDHLERLARLIDRYSPASFSEHLAWSSHESFYFNDLLPVAYNTATLTRVCAHINEVQTRLKRAMLLENPSTYVGHVESTWEEIEFIREVAERTGCGLLIDVNNVVVTCKNHGRDANAYIEDFPMELVGEIHLGGHDVQADSLGAPLLIDSHGCPVSDDVWKLYARTLSLTGPVATLIEWDNDVPELSILLAEAARANEALLDAASIEFWQLTS